MTSTRMISSLIHQTTMRLQATLNIPHPQRIIGVIYRFGSFRKYHMITPNIKGIEIAKNLDGDL
jgi:hypothetical protein